MPTAANPAELPLASRQRMIDQLNAIAGMARAQSDAARAKSRGLLLSPRLHVRIIMLRHAMELLALLVTLFAGPDQTTGDQSTGEECAPDQVAAPEPVQFQRTEFQRVLLDQARAQPAAPARSTRRRFARPSAVKTRASRATRRPERQPHRAGAAPNPNPAARARHHAPHRPLTPGATI